MSIPCANSRDYTVPIYVENNILSEWLETIIVFMKLNFSLNVTRTDSFIEFAKISIQDGSYIVLVTTEKQISLYIAIGHYTGCVWGIHAHMLNVQIPYKLTKNLPTPLDIVNVNWTISVNKQYKTNKPRLPPSNEDNKSVSKSNKDHETYIRYKSKYI